MLHDKELLLDICDGKKPDPTESHAIKKMRVVDLSNSDLKDVSRLIPYLKSVKKLILKDTRIDTIPETIISLSSLEHLDLSGTPLKEFPESICGLLFLKRLYLSNTSISALPGTIENLVNLEKLYLECTNISVIPEEINNLKKLKTISLEKTKIEHLPSEMSALKQLIILNLSDTEISALPESISQCENLRILDLNSTKIETLPDSINQLNHLERLVLSHSLIKELPEAIGDLQNLRELYLSFTPIVQLPNSIENLSLKKLDLQFSKIESIDAIINNHSLEDLDLAYTNVKVSTDMGKVFPKLKYLNISYTDVDVEALIAHIDHPMRIMAAGMNSFSVQTENVQIDNTLNSNYYLNRVGIAYRDTEKFRYLAEDFIKNNIRDRLVSSFVNFLQEQKTDTSDNNKALTAMLIMISGQYSITQLDKNTERLYLEQFIRYYKLLIKNDRYSETHERIQIIKSIFPNIINENVIIILNAIRQDIVQNNAFDDYGAKALVLLLCFSQLNNKNLIINENNNVFELCEGENGITDEIKRFKLQYVDLPAISEYIVRSMQNYIERATSIHFRFSQSRENLQKKSILINTGSSSSQSIYFLASFDEKNTYWIEEVDAEGRTKEELRITIDSVIKNDLISVSVENSAGICVSNSLGFSINEITGSYYHRLENEFSSKFRNFNSIEFEIVYLYVKNFRNIREKEYVFNDRYHVYLNPSNNHLSIIDNTTNQIEDIRKPKGFFGKDINNIYAFIGKNGTGKSSLIELFLNSKIFNRNGNYDAAQDYIIVFRRGEQLYWSDKNDRWILQDGIASRLSTNISPNEYYRIVNTKVALISNVFDPQRMLFHDVDNNEDSRIIIMTTQSMLNKDGVPNADIYRIINYYLYDQSYWEEKGMHPVDGIVWKNLHLEHNFSHINENKNGVELTLVPQYESILKEWAEIESLRDKDCKEHGERKLCQEYIDRLLRLMNKIGKDDVLKKEIQIGFSDMSSGESARLTVFARILSLFKMDDRMPDSLKYGRGGNYIIYFDEAELYFHPSWQRTLVNDIVSFLNNLNTNNEYFDTVTLFFSSNSPFLLSDLPESNVKYFQVMDEDIVIEKTFGQNIHVLLKNSFFMEDGVTGEFAKQRINKALQIINADTPPGKEDIQYVDYLCAILGEPILQRVISDEWEYKRK